MSLSRVPAICLSVLLSPLMAVAAVAEPAGLVGEAEADLGSPGREYFAYVCAESADQVSLLHLGPHGLEVVKTIEVGSFPAEIEGPHGIFVESDGDHWYVSLAHGFPFGSVHKFRTGTDEWLGEVTVGMFPATLTVSPTTDLLYVTNFDLHGEPVPGSLSVVETSTMTEIARVPTGARPHGARLNRGGDRLYAVSTVDDVLFELDALRFEVRRRLDLGVAVEDASQEQFRDRVEVAPTWATAPSGEAKIYVAGSKVDQIFEVDVEAWRLTRVFSPTGRTPYNLALAEPLNILVATYKGEAAVGFWDLVSGREIARVATSRPIPHGVVVTSDGAYSFVTLEGVGDDPGTVEVFDNRTQSRVASVEVGKQAAGIAIWEGSAAGRD